MKEGRSAISIALLLLTICVSSSSLQSQGRTRTLKFDFQKRDLSNPEVLDSIGPGDFYWIEITNINLNLYKVVIGKVDSSISKAVTVPTFGGFGIDQFTSLLKPLSPLGGIAGAGRAPASTEFSIESEEKGLGVNRAPAKDKEAQSLIVNYEDTVMGLTRKLRDDGRKLEDLILLQKKYSIESQVEYDTIQARPSLDAFSSSFKTLEGVRSDLRSLEDHSINTVDEYSAKIKTHAANINNDDELKKDDADLRKSFIDILSAITKAQAVVSSDSTLKYISSTIYAANNSSRVFRSLPLQFAKEKTSIDITITPRKDDALLQTYTTRWVFPSEGTFFWGVSSGFYWTGLYDEAYSTQQVDSTYFVVKENPGKAELGINAIFRFGNALNASGDVGWQAGFGPAVSISTNVKPRLLGGVGLAFGTKNKILLDAGAIAGYSDRLSNAYQTGVPYRTRPGTLSVSTLKYSYYLSISYLFYN